MMEFIEKLKHFQGQQTEDVLIYQQEICSAITQDLNGKNP